jgi:hypothetical protein
LNELLLAQETEDKAQTLFDNLIARLGPEVMKLAEPSQSAVKRRAIQGKVTLRQSLAISSSEAGCANTGMGMRSTNRPTVLQRMK